MERAIRSGWGVLVTLDHCRIQIQVAHTRRVLAKPLQLLQYGAGDAFLLIRDAPHCESPQVAWC